jgi:hypothetical protein
LLQQKRKYEKQNENKNIRKYINYRMKTNMKKLLKIKLKTNSLYKDAWLVADINKE